MTRLEAEENANFIDTIFIFEVHIRWGSGRGLDVNERLRDRIFRSKR